MGKASKQQTLRYRVTDSEQAGKLHLKNPQPIWEIPAENPDGTPIVIRVRRQNTHYFALVRELYQRDGKEIRLTKENFNMLWEAGEGNRLVLVRYDTDLSRTTTLVEYGGAIRMQEGPLQILEIRSGSNPPNWVENVTRDDNFKHKTLALRDGMPFPNDTKTVNGKVLTEIIAEALNASSSPREAFKYMIDSINPLRLLDPEEKPDREGRRIIVRADVMGAPQEKFKVNQDQIELFSKLGFTVSSVKTTDYYMANEKGLISKDKGENFRVRQVFHNIGTNPLDAMEPGNGESKKPNVVIVSYTSLEGGQSFSFDIDKDTADRLSTVFFSDFSILIKERTSYFWNGIVFWVDSNIRGMHSGIGVTSPIGNYVEIPKSRTDLDEERIKELKAEVGLSDATPEPRDYNRLLLRESHPEQSEAAA